MELPQQIKSLLIALPKGFGFRDLFSRKMEKLLLTVVVEDVTLIQDSLSIAKSYFTSRNISIREVNAFPRLSIKQKLASFTHIIIFWDGDDLTDLVFYAKVLKKPLRIIPVEVTKVRNKDKNESFDVYIGRGTPWGNPFPIGVGDAADSRDEVIEKYAAYFQQEVLNNPEKHKALLSLRGYRLACHCKPLPCHGDIIASYLNSYEEDTRFVSD